MPSFDVTLDHERSGEPSLIEAWGYKVPIPAVVVIAGAAKERNVALTLDVDALGQLRVLGVEVVGTDRKPVVTSDALRAFRLPQLVRAALVFLRTMQDDDGHARATISLFTAEDLRRDDWEPADYYPPVVFGANGLVAEPDWLSSLKAAGPRSKRATRTISALFDMASENDQAPNAFIQRMLDMNSATASRWVQAAREAGLIKTPARKRRDV